ncbi:MAG TPA: glycosyltransferase family 9 protein [Bacteroidia bacterium]|nr:glycosyltransferase family 9 protein [Bacteroidia bacterium]
MKKILIIQTAFTGDVILATALIDSIRSAFPDVRLDVLVRKGNESLLENNPAIRKILVWDKRIKKFRHLVEILHIIRAEKYTDVINLQRFASSGLLTVFSGAKITSGFNKNPFSLLFTHRVPHIIGNGKHETERNQELIHYFMTGPAGKPRLYPSLEDVNKVSSFKAQEYICIAPGSVWFTKTFPKSKWVEFIRHSAEKYPGRTIYLLGSPAEEELCNQIISESSCKKAVNLSGKLSFLESAALMKDAKMNFVNDSAPLHIASAMNAPVTAIYCSTIPAFGFGPLSVQSRIVETKEKLSCRPCGLHGLKTCPKKHFRCATEIEIHQLD